MLSRTEMSFCSASTSNHFNIIKNNKSTRIVFPTLLWGLMIACFLVLVQPFCSFAEDTGLFGDGRLTLYANHESKSQSLSCIIETGEGGLIVIDGGWNINSEFLLKQIQAKGGHVQAWLLTHPDSDHVGAITTILNYVIIIAGAMTVFGSLGVSWDKLQWLAAALSVGLGFGLQEIFGNFVSGLIILFERPVRIGDTVTIGTFSGTVSKIRIRATTITDFDRKEVIIPNKAFVTERLINWSLSDTTTRVVIRLGVAYGSDLDKVKEVLLKAASEHPKVMHDPAPAVFFTTFGPSTLDHELRLYVRELRDRSYTVDELNRAIDRLCRENDINIAFNQLEVHLRNEKGEEHTEVKREIKGDDPTPA